MTNLFALFYLLLGIINLGIATGSQNPSGALMGASFVMLAIYLDVKDTLSKNN